LKNSCPAQVTNRQAEITLVQRRYKSLQKAEIETENAICNKYTDCTNKGDCL